MTTPSVPPIPSVLIRSHEIMNYKRCPKMWYWKWRMGLVPKEKSFGALELGTWIHEAFALWYASTKKRRTMAGLVWCFDRFALTAIKSAKGNNGTPDHLIEAATGLYKLGKAMLTAYAEHYQGDKDWEVIGAEIPLEIEITDQHGQSVGTYRMKLDLVVRDRTTDHIWIVEHKTAKAIRVEHLSIDGQARPYGALAELAMKRAGILKPSEKIEGILYNFLRKAMPDKRVINSEGLALNKNGSVSKRQPTPTFRRYPVKLTNKAKRVALERIRLDVIEIMGTRFMLHKAKDRERMVSRISKTSHWSCPRFCEFFAMCELEEQGGDIRQLMRGTFTRRDPYAYETTDEVFGFEMG